MLKFKNLSLVVRNGGLYIEGELEGIALPGGAPVARTIPTAEELLEKIVKYAGDWVTNEQRSIIIRFLRHLNLPATLWARKQPLERMKLIAEVLAEVIAEVLAEVPEWDFVGLVADASSLEDLSAALETSEGPPPHIKRNLHRILQVMSLESVRTWYEVEVGEAKEKITKLEREIAALRRPKAKATRSARKAKK